jgi:hypothetical protein
VFDYTLRVERDSTIKDDKWQNNQLNAVLTINELKVISFDNFQMGQK